MKQYIISTMLDVVLHCFCFFFVFFVWCPCMAINLSVQYSGGLLPEGLGAFRFFFKHLSSRTATPPMPSTLGMYSLLRTNSSIFRHPPSPQQPPYVPIAHPGRIGFVFLSALQLRRCSFEPLVGISGSISRTSCLPVRCQSKQTAKKSCAQLVTLTPW